MSDWWAWAQDHAAEAAWIVFGVLSLIIVAYRRVEPQWKDLARASKTRIDDKLVSGLGVFLGWVAALLDLVKMVVPHAASSIRPAAPDDEPEKKTKKKKG